MVLVEISCVILRDISKVLLAVLRALSAAIFIGATGIKAVGSCFLVGTLDTFEVAIPVIIRTSEIGHVEYLLKNL